MTEHRDRNQTLRTKSPVVALFPEASFGAALNCVGIAQALRSRGAKPVFICNAGFAGVFANYGFQEYILSSPTGAEGRDYWQSYVQRHLPHFDLSPIDQIETYVAPTWSAIVDTMIEAQAPLQELLKRLKPDAVVLDNVIMFPAIAKLGCPWIRVVSCAETEIPDAAVPPYLSGLAADDKPRRATFEKRYLAAIANSHSRFNEYRSAFGLAALSDGLFLEESPHLNLLLTPSIVKRKRQNPLPVKNFTYLEGCVRSEGPFHVPRFPNSKGPLVYVSFGSLGAMDVRLLERMMAVFAKLPARFMMNVGSLKNNYNAVPNNVYLDSWYPQPSVLAQSDLFIHHGGNNSFCEALNFGKPSLIMPYCWDGHDNAQLATETGVGARLHRSKWTEDELATAIEDLLENQDMKQKLLGNVVRMRETPGAETAAMKIMKVI
jgi:MGT family glycosyltransferase